MSNLKRYKPKTFMPLSKETTFDKIFASYLEDGYELSPKLEEIRDRWFKIWCMLCDGKSPNIVRDIIATELDISTRQVERDMNNAIRLYGAVRESNKEGYRHILFEYCNKVWEFASLSDPPNLQEMNRAVANMIKLKGLDREDPEKGIDWSALEPHEIRVMLPEGVSKYLMTLIAQGSTDFDEVLDTKAIDITHLQKPDDGKEEETEEEDYT